MRKDGVYFDGSYIQNIRCLRRRQATDIMYILATPIISTQELGLIIISHHGDDDGFDDNCRYAGSLVSAFVIHC